EDIEVFQVLDQGVAHRGYARWRQALAGAQKMQYFTENPGISLGGAPDHEAVGPRLFQDLHGLLRGTDIAVGDDRDAHRRLDRGDGFVLSIAREHVGARATVHGERLNTVILGDARDQRAVFVLPVPAGADFQCHRRTRALHDGVENLRYQGLIAH